MKLLFLGDFFFDYDYLPEDFQEICRFVQRENYQVILNLETTLGTGGSPIQKRGAALKSTPLTLDALKQLNVKAVCLANNHTMDYGEESLQETLEQLDKNNILHVGAGTDLKHALQAVELPGTSVVLQNFAWPVEEAVAACPNAGGVAPLDRALILEHTRALRAQEPGKFIVNVYHWGFEYNLWPMPLDIQFAHQSLEAGADLIIGHHPHVVQPFEVYKNKKIFYSLGNFYFGSRRKKYKKQFNATPRNACDYGLGVVLDTQTHQCESCVGLAYNHPTDASVVQTGTPAYLTDMTDASWQSKEYVKKVKNTSCNFNPVLTTNPLQNTVSLHWLMLKYKIAASLKFMKKSKAGCCLFEWAKK